MEMTRGPPTCQIDHPPQMKRSRKEKISKQAYKEEKEMKERKKVEKEKGKVKNGFKN
jgi:hypothetical protein